MRKSRWRWIAVIALIAGLASISAVVLALAAETGILGGRTPDAPSPNGAGQYALTRFVRAEAGDAWETLADAGVPRRAVVLVHGLDEPGTIWDTLTPALAEAGYDVLRFDYPNDQRIADSAALLEVAMQALRAQGCEEVRFVCHSMGGLVVRDALTRETRGDWPDVGRLILVGTPNHGSPLALLRGVAEAREQIVRWARSLSDPPPLDAYLSDGNGEAGEDLAPGSAFLTDLNARPLATGVPITIIAGRLAPVSDEDARSLLDSSLLQWIAGDRDVEAISEAINLLGDGVVPLDSAMLEGVDDVTIVSANHRAILKRSALESIVRDAADAPGALPPAIPIILDRLAEDRQR